MEKAVFMDKDGVLNVDNGIDITLPLQLFPDAGRTISSLRKKDYLIIIVTNQTIISRGIMDEGGLAHRFDDFRSMLLKQDGNAVIDDIYYCPHHPNASLIDYRMKCRCRKPKPGMLLSAAHDHSIDLKASFMVGDRISDILAGYLAGCKTVICKTGKHTEKMIETDLQYPDVKPDYVISRIGDIRTII